MVMAAKAYFEDTFRQEERPETRGGANKTSENVLASVRHDPASTKPLVQEEDCHQIPPLRPEHSKAVQDVL